MAILSGSISKEFEIWKDIVGYEGLYQISNLGRVKSLKRYVPHFKGGLKVVPERMKTIFYQKDGRPRVELSKGNLNRKFFVYRLVAQAFIPNPNNYPCINHKDENPANNSIENLEWCTYKYNANYGTRGYWISITKYKPVGMFHPTLNVLMRVFDSGKEAAEFLRVSRSCMTAAIDDDNRKIKGYKFKFI